MAHGPGWRPPLVDQHLILVYAVAFGLAVGGVFFNPAASWVLPSLVDEDELVAANSGLWSAMVISQIALAPLAGALVATVGVGPAFLVNAASFAGSALLLVGLRLPGRPAATATPSWLGRVGEGARLLVADRLLRLLGLVQLLGALSAGATSALLVVLAGRQLRVGPDGFWLLLAAIGVGAAVGPLLLARLVSNPRRPALVFGPLLLRGLVDLVLATTRSLAIAMGALAVYGMGTSTGMVTYNSLLQASVAPEVRGRCSPASTCCGRPAGWPRWCWAAWRPMPWASVRCTTWAVGCCWWPAWSGWWGGREASVSAKQGPDLSEVWLALSWSPVAFAPGTPANASAG